MAIMKCELLNFGGYDQLEYDFTTIHPEVFLEYDQLIVGTGIWKYWNFNEFKVRPDVE